MREKLLARGPAWRRWILLGTVFLVPVLFLRNLNDPINVPKFGVLMSVVVLVTFLRTAELLQGATARSLRILWIPAAAVLGPLTIAWLLSPYRAWALFGSYPRLLGLIPYVVVVLFGILLADAFSGEPEPIAWAMLAAGGLAGAYALLQAIGLDPYRWEVAGLEATGAPTTLGNPNFAGGFFAIVIPVGVGLALARPGLRSRSLPLTLLMMGGWIASTSQGGWLAGVAGLSAASAIWLGRERPLVRWLGFGGALLCAALTVGVVLAAFNENLAERLPATVERRAEWWSAAIDMTSASPLVGRGPNAFALEHPRYRTIKDAKLGGLVIADEPHSVLLSFTTAGGLLGGVGFLLMVAWLLRAGLLGGSANPLTAAFFASVVAYLVQSLVSIDTVALRTALWVGAAGLAVSLPVASSVPRGRPPKRSVKKHSRQPVRWLPVMALLPVAGIGALWWSTGFITADGRLQHAHNQLRDGRFEDARASYEAAIEHRGEIAYRRAYARTLWPLGLALEEDGQPLISEAQHQLSYVRDVPHVNSIRDAAVMLRDWAVIEEAAEEESLRTYEDAIALDPLDPELLAEAGLAAVTFEQPEWASELLARKAVVLDDARVWGTLALAQAKLGDLDSAAMNSERALEIDPEQPSALEAKALLQSSG